uniref:Uncharacterized protein n=1 Tax=Megaselia scalaris TaxID=36166 RepID=T1GNG0_MEGSC
MGLHDQLVKYLSLMNYSFKKYNERRILTPSIFVDVFKILVELEDAAGVILYQKFNQNSVPIYGANGEFRVKVRLED